MMPPADNLDSPAEVAGLRGPAADDEQMWAGSDQFRRNLDGSDEAQKCVGASRVSEPVVKVGGDQCGPFAAKVAIRTSPASTSSGDKFAGMMKVDGRKPVRTTRRVAVLPVGKVALDDTTKVIIGEHPRAKAVAQRCVPADRRGEHHPVGTQHPRRACDSASSRALRWIKWYRDPSMSTASALASA
jgi:hypothetical protein